MAISVSASPLESAASWKMPILSHTPAAARNPELDQELDLGGGIDAGDGINFVYPYLLNATATILGTWKNVNTGYAEENVLLAIASITCEFYRGVPIPVEPMQANACLEEPWLYLDPRYKNWVKWAKIGSMDFTIDRSNVAGERPMDWKGWVYVTKKLANKVVVYGENGVTFLTPLNNFWGMSTVSHIGLLQRAAVCGNDFMHFFIDKKGRLCKVDEQLTVLGYEEFLAGMLPSLVMSYDELNQLVYICDGVSGYVYSVRSLSLGTGPANVTGVGVQDGSLYVAASSAVSIDPFEMCTDIYDMGNRKNKTIHSIEIGIDLTQALYGAIDYRSDKSAAFASTPWVRVNPNGVTHLPCFGVEFRFRFKVLVYEQFDIDYIRVNGVLHNASYLDVFAREGRK